jgi:CRISPR-associated endonuclease/helicase Cas3
MESPGGESIAHVREKDGARQTLEDHLFGTASLSRKHAEKITLGVMGELQGLLHDIGKYSPEFQAYLASAEGILDQDSDEYVDAAQKKGKIDHSSAGAQYLWKNIPHNDPLLHSAAQILALSIASHHSGLIDCLAPDGSDIFTRRMNKPDRSTHFTEVLGKIPIPVTRRIQEILEEPELYREFRNYLSSIIQKEKDHHTGTNNEKMSLVSFKIGLTLRMLFSCLIDGDRTDTANFEKDWTASARQEGDYVSWSVLAERLEQHLESLKSDGPVNETRKKVSEECRAAAMRERGFFTLSVPTGGGKTLASLRFALHHALRFEHSPRKIDRILYVIPYTSIIDQNAQVARDILEKHHERNQVVLECHSNLSEEWESWRSRLLSENWDAPIVFTTSVQFLEALFGGGTRSVRRMHQLANTILIFDEIQTLPVRTVHMFCNALNFLVDHCGTSAVLCTATQPLLHKVNRSLGSLRCSEKDEIVQDVPVLFETFRRVDVFDRTRPKGYTDEEIASLTLNQQKNFTTCLVVVNTTGMARRLYGMIKGAFSETVHLSAAMCPAHRREVLKQIRNSLEKNPQLPLICVSTQVIEAGVDLDFGSVIRCLAGMDSMAQAAGRCNRHGLREKGQVLIVNPREDPIDRLVDIKVGRDEAQILLQEMKNEGCGSVDLLHPDVMTRYFEHYFFKRAEDMAYPVTEHRNDTLLNMLSSNTMAAAGYRPPAGYSHQIPLKQSFASAASLFQAIDASTRGVIVPYGEGREVITELSGKIDNPAGGKALLRRAQFFAVNVYPNIFNKLIKSNAVYEINGLGLWGLREEYYSQEFGLAHEAVTRLETEVH